MRSPKVATLAAHLAARRQLAAARHEVHGLGHVANVMLEIEDEIARLDAKILELEETIARLSDDHRPQQQRLTFWRFKVDVVVNDKKQLRELVTVLRSWRRLLADEEGPRAVGAANMLSDLLTHVGKVEGVDDEEPPVSSEPPPDGMNGNASKSRRWG